MTQFDVRAATEADLPAIAAIALATGQDEDWDQVFPAYQHHLLAHGTLLVAERDGTVAGYGATLRIGSDPTAISMLADLFVHPSAHGTGCGRAILDVLWRDEPRRMTFSSLHAHALPLYTSFGLDAWWPLLYLSGDVRRLQKPDGWTVEAAESGQVSALELGWTGVDRLVDHQLWAAWPMGTSVVASRSGQPAAAGTVGGAASEFGITHLAIDPAIDPADHAIGHSRSTGASDAVTAVLSWLNPPAGRARVCLPAPHPALRSLLAAGWRIDEFDLHMASEPDLIDPRRAVPSAGLA
jgi:GNAT superfamily N-acetyltransferase